MPDGSHFWDEGKLPAAVPVKPSVTPAAAEQAHRQGRYVGCEMAIAAELGAVTFVVTALMAQPWIPLLSAYAAYGFGLNRAHEDRNYTTTSVEPEGEWSCYPDLIRTYDSPRNLDHTPENFRPYQPTKALWRYSLGGLWDGFTNRAICSYLWQTTDSFLYNLRENNRPRDKFKPRRLNQGPPEWHRHRRRQKPPGLQ